MTEIAQKIASITEALPADAQRALLDVAESLARSGRTGSFVDTMSAEQRAELDQALAEARRGEVTDDAALDGELDALFAARP